MKTTLVTCCTVALIAIVAVFAFNSGKGPALQKEGISELKPPAKDSLLIPAKTSIAPMYYRDQDLQAIATYLNNR